MPAMRLCRSLLFSALAASCLASSAALTVKVPGDPNRDSNSDFGSSPRYEHVQAEGGATSGESSPRSAFSVARHKIDINFPSVRLLTVLFCTVLSMLIVLLVLLVLSELCSALFSRVTGYLPPCCLFSGYFSPNLRMKRLFDFIVDNICDVLVAYARD